jgi:hypothetical protein
MVRSACGLPLPATRHLTRGFERAHSWAVDAHKWLNVPYDAAMAIVADSDTHVAAMSLAGAYLVVDPGQRDNTNYVPESATRSRRTCLCGHPIAGPRRCRGTDRTQLRPGTADGRPAGGDSWREGPQRRRSQPGVGAAAGRR